MKKQPVKTHSKQHKINITFWDNIIRFPIVYLFFLVLAFLIYGQTLHFIMGKLDEDYLILGNLSILKDFANIKQAFLKDAFLSDKGVAFYRPFQTVSFMVDAHFNNGRGSGFYLTNILIHAGTCSALFYLLTLFNNQKKAAFIFTLIYLTSPLFVHAISWAPSRGDLLIGLTSILSMIFYIKMITTLEYKYIPFILITFSVAMFSKETAIAFPFLVLSHYILFGGGINRHTLPPLLITFGGFLLIVWLYFSLRSNVILIATSPKEFGIIPLMHNLRTLPEYIAKFFIPIHLSPMPGFTYFNTGLGLLLMSCIACFSLFISLKPFRNELFGLSWFLLFAIPGTMYSHKIGSAAYDYLEHRSYLPMVGIIILLFLIFNDLQDVKWKNIITKYALLLAVVFSVYAFYNAGNYESPMAFYNRAIKTNPASAMALNNRGTIRAGLKDFEGAIADYEKALIIKNDYSKAYVNEGVALAALNDKTGAIEKYNSAIRYEPDLFQAHFNKANAVSGLGLFEEAIKEYTISLELNPNYLPGYSIRGSVYFQLRDFSAAEKDFSKAIEFDNKNAVAYMYRGKARFMVNNLQGACADWRMASNLGNGESLDLYHKYCK